jgi:FkbM family methyltransferase
MIKKIIRNLLQKIGYDIVKTESHSSFSASKNYTIKLGNFSIVMPGNNPQINNYKNFPELNTQLARLAKIVQNKYPNTTLLDVGANVGDTIAIVKSAVDIEIIGIEGDPVTFKFLETNVKQIAGVKVLNQFLGEETKIIQADLDKHGWNGTIIPNEKSNSKISLKTLDRLLEENNLIDKNHKLLKIDVEGFDTIVIRGSKKIIQQKKPVLYFEYNRENMDKINENGLDTIFSLQQYGYKYIIFFDCKNKYILDTTLSNTILVTQMHNYSNGFEAMIGYYDIAIIHEHDEDLVLPFIEGEEKFYANK